MTTTAKRTTVKTAVAFVTVSRTAKATATATVIQNNCNNGKSL